MCADGVHANITFHSRCEPKIALEKQSSLTFLKGIEGLAKRKSMANYKTQKILAVRLS